MAKCFIRPGFQGTVRSAPGGQVTSMLVMQHESLQEQGKCAL